jgi:hypothetical protein
MPPIGEASRLSAIALHPLPERSKPDVEALSTYSFTIYGQRGAVRDIEETLARLTIGIDLPEIPNEPKIRTLSPWLGGGITGN